MKTNAFCVIAVLFALAFASSCVEKGYDFDSINKEGAFSHEKGMYIQIGDFDTVYLQNVNINYPVEVTTIKTIAGFFSETIYDYLVYSSNGRDESLGGIALEGDFVAHVVDPASKGFSDFELSAEIFKEDMEDTGIRIEKTYYKADNPGSQVFNVTINKDDVLKLKDAYGLRLIFNFEAKEISAEDYVLIHNVKLKALGGISFSFD
jgi:hypothetical protein